jgi:hypothetical protein
MEGRLRDLEKKLNYAVFRGGGGEGGGQISVKAQQKIIIMSACDIAFRGRESWKYIPLDFAKPCF